MNQNKKKTEFRMNPYKPVLIFLAGFILSAAGCSEKQNTVKAVVETVLEYGMVLQPERLVSGNTENRTVSLHDSDGKSLPALPEPGEYILDVYLDDQKIGESRLLVKDTIAPHFLKSADTVDLPPDAAVMDSELIRSEFTASDLSGVTLLTDDSHVKYGETGIYDAEIICKDGFGNESRKTFQVQIGDHSISKAGDDSDSASEEESDQKSEKDSERSESNPADGFGTVVDGILIVNKKHPISSDYNPGNDPTALAALNALLDDMQNAGFDMSRDFSGFRDYSYQASLYNSYVSRDGSAAADTYSARPGYSEHQTGLTFDVKHSDGSLVTRTPEAEWLKNHAADYGFIIRYPYGKESITGYSPEPWHLRYVGKKAASEIMSRNLTLEEYLGVEGGDYSN